MASDKLVNISNTINSGQVFLWEKYDKTWFGVNGTDVLEVNEDFDSDTCDKTQYAFFRLDDEYKKILKNISADKFVRQGVKKYPGLRLLRQDPFQCYISFIVSSNSNIPNIKMRLKKICQKFGKKITLKQNVHYLFPSPKKLAKASIGELQSCGLGYRTRFVKGASEKVFTDDINLESLKSLNYDTVKSTLMQALGIGDKVADCIMLFSLEKLNAFPLDTWMLQALQKFYPKKFPIAQSLTKKKYQTLHNQIVDYFGSYAGLSQQFLFKMIRDQNQKKWL